jgi:hypothetical protein
VYFAAFPLTFVLDFACIARYGFSANQFACIARYGFSANQFACIARYGFSANQFACIARDGFSANRFTVIIVLLPIPVFQTVFPLTFVPKITATQEAVLLSLSVRFALHNLTYILTFAQYYALNRRHLFSFL